PEAEPLSPEEFLPAIGQGALAVEAVRSGPWWSLLAELNDVPSALAAAAERSFLRAVGGDCKTPVAAHATVSGATIRVRALIADPSGRRVIEGERSGSATEGETLGRTLAEDLLAEGGREILEEIAG
ncbi:MAG: hydroxymethylbilane synthase, partial [Candidatus Binatia bacterium]